MYVRMFDAFLKILKVNCSCFIKHQQRQISVTKYKYYNNTNITKIKILQ